MQRPGAAYWIGVLLVPLALIALLNAADRPYPLDGYAVDTVVWLASEADDPPEFGEQASGPFKLPGYIDAEEDGLSSFWMQSVLRVDTQPKGLWAAYLPNTQGNFSVYVNGQQIGESAPMKRPYAFFREPLFFEFPAGVLRQGENTLQMRIAADRAGAVQVYYVGPSETLKPAFDHRHFLRVPVQRAILAALVIVTFLMLGLFAVRPADTGYAFFAAANAAWGVHVWMQLEPRVLIDDTRAWFSLPIILLLWFSIFSAFFIHRLPGCGGPRPRWERVMLIFGVLASVVLIATRSAGFLGYVYMPGILIIGASTAWRLIDAIRRQPTFEVKLWLLGATVCVVVGLRDYLLDQLALPGSLHYLTYTVSIVLIVAALTLLSRISRALTEAETLNRELESRVAAKGAELERNYQELRVLERERLLGAERERMTRDMHDGIGGQLMHALSVAESKPEYRPLEPILRSSLDDLRLIIDAVDPSGGDLLAVLGSFRTRNERRVREAGVKLVWEMGDLPLVPEFGPNKALQLLRILQEATTNVLRHSRATQLTVRTATLLDEKGETKIVVEVIDNGVGYTEAAQAGHGLNNMRRRAGNLGAQLELTSGADGSRVRLLLPVGTERTGSSI